MYVLAKPGNGHRSQGTEPPLNSATLWYRYWLFGWIFEDCNRGDLFANAAALRRNRGKARLLPIYLLRYTATASASLIIARVIGDAAPLALQLLALAPLIACVPLLVVSLAIWIALCVPQV